MVASNITINGQNESRAGSVTFEDFAYLNFNFTRYNSNSEVDSAIANITYPFQGQTNTPDGLDVARTQVCGFLPNGIIAVHVIDKEFHATVLQKLRHVFIS
jgi:hypothetical protein